MNKIITLLVPIFISSYLFAQTNNSDFATQTFPASYNYNFIVNHFNRVCFISYNYLDSNQYKTGNKKVKRRIEFLNTAYENCNCILTVLANYADSKSLSLDSLIKNRNEEILHIYKTYNGDGAYIYGPYFEPLSKIKLIDIEYLQAFLAMPKKSLDDLLIFSEQLTK